MALILEEGAGDNPDANSYKSVADLRRYASLRGEDLSELTDTECEVLLIKAMDFLEAKRDRYQGRKTKVEQPLQWPRDDVWDVSLAGAKSPSDEIPRELEYAQLSLAVIAKDYDLMPNSIPGDKGAIVREKIEGAIEMEYDSTGRSSFIPAFSKPESLLKPLYKQGGLFLVRT